MPKLRTIDGAYDYLHDKDSDTALTKTALRRLVVTGVIPSTRVGAKYLVDVERMEAFLAGSFVPQEQSPIGKIRPVNPTNGRPRPQN